MLNLRFKYIVLSSFFFVIKVVPRANKMIANRADYTEEECCLCAKEIMDYLRRRGRTTTIVSGKENIPEDTGCVFYSNHQGKYDALGILLAIDEPCGVLFGKKQAERLLSKQVVGLLDGVTIDLEDPRDEVNAIKKVTDGVKRGRKFLVFPEGGYTDNKNTLQEFHTGCFNCSIRSQTPIVPVCIYDSYKSMNSNTFEKVETQVHFLKPITVEEYKGMKKPEIAKLVKERIQEKINSIETEK
ncbi:MAG: 1-acyl-sn-glycerol-3-phosphate acyltransferase [Clostridium sp.]|nr:1-acyl-sn-glycerol-3-phosphate acyltransferase [Clostridium sp.]MCM1400207.1 1-acyl-sn-glycerol-3-phosphate acyltransferase [Clostridium sp.]MCM1460924.1 1-acyl-sn-glycerol-3-phosphate acyltransferase [Bacteroides sp.]